MSKTVEAVIFDLGRVLIDVNFSQLFKGFMPENERKNYLFNLENIMQLPWFREFSSGKCNELEFYNKVTNYFNIEISLDQFRQEWSSVFSPIPGMNAIVEKLSARMPVSLLSDTDSIHWTFLLSEYPFLSIFKEPVLSFKIGNLKPAEICYYRAAESVKKPLASCLFIDDRRVNVAGAEKSGMQAIQFESAEKLIKTFKENYRIFV